MTARRTVEPEPVSESVNLREVLAVLRRNRWLVLAVAMVAFGLSAFVALRTVPLYRAKAVIRVANTRQAITGGLSDEGQPSTVGLYTDPLRSLLQVVTSRQIAAEVVDSTPVPLRVAVDGIPAELVTDVHVAPGAPADTIPLRFDAAGVSVTGAAGAARAAYGAPVELPGLRFTVTKAPPAATGAIRIVARENAVSAVVAGLRATQRTESDIVDVEFRSPDPRAAQLVVNSVVQVFQRANAQSSLQQSRRRRLFVEEQLRQNDSLLNTAQRALAGFRGREQTFSTREKFSNEQRDLMGLEVQREGFAADRAVYRSLLTRMQDARGSGREEGLRTLVSSPGIAANPIITQLYTQLSRYQATRDSLTTGAWANATTHPDVQRLDTLIASAQGRMLDAVRSQVISLDARISVLDTVRARNSTTLQRLPGVEAEELRFANLVESSRRVGEQLREEYQKAKIAEAVEVGQVEIVDLAPGPGTPLGGGPLPKMMIGLLVGLVLGTGAAFLREHLDTTITRREDIERVLRLPSLAVIPAVAAVAGKRNGSRNGNGATHGGLSRISSFFNGNGKNGDGGNGGHPPNGNGKANGHGEQGDALKARPISGPVSTPMTEAYVTLRTNLLFTQATTKLKTILVTSTAPKDGKTTVAANLARTLAQHGTRVLLVDCDLRRPRVHRMFGVQAKPGLADVLLDPQRLDEAIHRPGNRELYVLPAGASPPNASQLLSSGAMRELLDKLCATFDMVVLDSPPVLAVADASILAGLADGILFVVRAGSTERDNATGALQQLSAVGARVVGVVLNDPDAKVPEYGGYYYKYYYDYASEARE
ncbi:MAG: polysaccharide biosynthesis tyrosine autokinase [Gemmatimonadaceae bacterium]